MVLMLVIAFQGGKKKKEFVNGTDTFYVVHIS